MKHNTIMIVDDDNFNLEILDKHLRKNNYRTDLSNGGARAWDLLTAEPQKYSLVLLDRMMPEVDGMEVLDRLKAHPELKYLPVIMQTSASSPEQIAEGIARGVYYYLTKPFNREVLLSLVAAAVNDYDTLLDLKKNLESNILSMRNLDRAQFTFQTIAEGKNIINLLAHAGTPTLDIAIGLTELVVNAVEHGNLGIGYKEKGQLLSNNKWEEEIHKRYQLPPYRDKYVTLQIEKETAGREGEPCLRVSLKDQGEGFAWQEYMKFSMERLGDPHGRGILIANNTFIKLEYLDNGSCVNAWFKVFS